MAAPNNPAPFKSEKLWRNAIERAVKRRQEGKGSPRMLERLADSLVQAGISGDVSALKEIGDRLDGKAVQPISGDASGPPITFVVEK